MSKLSAFEKWLKKKKGEYESHIGHKVDDYTLVLHDILTFEDTWLASKKYWLRWALKQSFYGKRMLDAYKIRAEIQKVEAEK